ncbi:hypothetical protein FA95DRAFT_1472428, partial [Auriscalpium vulgare]
KIAIRHRPAQIAVWYKDGRPWHKGKMEEKDVPKFADAFKLWWAELQPPTRRLNDGLLAPPSSDMDWSQLCVGGTLGFLVVIVAAFWW